MTGYDMHRNDRPDYEAQGTYITDLFTAEALKIIDYHRINKPLYLQISHLAPHEPLEIPNEYLYRQAHDDFRHIYDANRRKYASKFLMIFLYSFELE